MPEATSSSDANRPLDIDELLLRDNVPARRRMPRAIARELETRRVYISGSTRRPRMADVSVQGDSDGSTRLIRLEPGSVLGLPGRSLTRPEGGGRSRTRAPQRFDAFRPEWADLVYHPKRTTEPPWVHRQRHVRGRTGELFYGVFGNDDRAIYYPSGYPWQCIGKVYAWTDVTAGPAWWGSGVLIGPRLVLTAGHVVPWDASPWMMQFVPAYYDGRSILGEGAQSYVSDAYGWDSAYRSRLPEANDTAVLRLFDPLGDWLGYFGWQHFAEGQGGMRYFNINGYPAAIASAERPAYQPGVEVDDVVADGSADELDHRGDATGGNSGGPFWGIWPDGYPYAIGAISGGEVWTDSKGNVTKDTNIAAGGMLQHDAIVWARTNWP